MGSVPDKLEMCSKGDELSIHTSKSKDITDSTVTEHDTEDRSMEVRVGHPGFVLNIRYAQPEYEARVMGPVHEDIAEEYGFDVIGVLNTGNLVEFMEDIERISVEQ